MLKAIAYVSSAKSPMTESMLESIHSNASRFNESVSVTGVLLFKNGLFFQYIEGVDNDVEAVYRRILQSRSHSRITELVNSDVQNLEFLGWSMGFFEAFESTILQLSQASWVVAKDRLDVSQNQKSDGILFLHSFIRAASIEA